jgi:hypothetical protein
VVLVWFLEPSAGVRIMASGGPCAGFLKCNEDVEGEWGTLPLDPHVLP